MLYTFFFPFLNMKSPHGVQFFPVMQESTYLDSWGKSGKYKKTKTENLAQASENCSIKLGSHVKQ